MTSALTPALSPGRGRIVRRSFENLIRLNWPDFHPQNQKQPKAISSPVRLRFASTRPLNLNRAVAQRRRVGERIKGEGGLKTLIPLKTSDNQFVRCVLVNQFVNQKSLKQDDEG